MIINLDETSLTGQTSWEIHYLNDENCPYNRQVLPKARTNGLANINDYELTIRLVPPHKAAPILDQIGLWIFKNRPTNDGDIFIVFKESYKIKIEMNENGDEVQMLSWSKDT
jgi:hypothetical protein